MKYQKKVRKPFSNHLLGMKKNLSQLFMILLHFCLLFRLLLPAIALIYLIETQFDEILMAMHVHTHSDAHIWCLEYGATQTSYLDLI